MKREPLELLNLIAQILFDKKGTNILALDVRGISSLTDFFLIAEGSVDRHLTAMATGVMDALKELGEKPLYLEGLFQESDGGWIVLDYLEIVIHLLTPQMRDKYRLEELWGEGKIIDLNFKSLRAYGE